MARRVQCPRPSTNKIPRPNNETNEIYPLFKFKIPSLISKIDSFFSCRGAVWGERKKEFV